MYGYISELQKGIKNPVPMTDTEVNEVKNLKKRVDLLRSQIHAIDEELSSSEGSSSGESEESSQSDHENSEYDDEVYEEEKKVQMTS